jgi:hypothetical protein
MASEVSTTRRTRPMSIADIKLSMFYEFPMWLMHEEELRDMSANAKLLYMMLFNSLDNSKEDENGVLYFSYTRATMSEKMGCTQQMVIKNIKELNDFGLLDEVRQGGRSANRIYLKYQSEPKFNIQTEWGC